MEGGLHQILPFVSTLKINSFSQLYYIYTFRNTEVIFLFGDGLTPTYNKGSMIDLLTYAVKSRTRNVNSSIWHQVINLTVTICRVRDTRSTSMTHSFCKRHEEQDITKFIYHQELSHTYIMSRRILSPNYLYSLLGLCKKSLELLVSSSTHVSFQSCSNNVNPKSRHRHTSWERLYFRTVI